MFFCREDGDFVTITNDEDLVTYLKENQRVAKKYLFRNGVFSLCELEAQVVAEWKT